MPYKKTKIKIPLCTTDADAYGPRKTAEIVIVDSSHECLAHYVDLDTVSCLKRKPVDRRVIHFYDRLGDYTHNLLTCAPLDCSQYNSTTTKSDVTCKRCLKIIKD